MAMTSIESRDFKEELQKRNRLRDVHTRRRPQSTKSRKTRVFFSHRAGMASAPFICYTWGEVTHRKSRPQTNAKVTFEFCLELGACPELGNFSLRAKFANSGATQTLTLVCCFSLSTLAQRVGCHDDDERTRTDTNETRKRQRREKKQIFCHFFFFLFFSLLLTHTASSVSFALFRSLENSIQW
jgi:hypothetical protein